MAGFTYNGHSTEGFISETLTVTFIDHSPEGYGIDRDIEAGSPTIFRPIPNQYGSIDNPQDIEFSLLKCSGTEFTREEQRKIETWLTAPKISTPLYFIPSGKKPITGPTPYYYGIFTKTEWIPGGQGFQAVKLTFRPTTAYPFMKETIKIKLTGQQITKKITVPTLDTDECFYPVITIKGNKANLYIKNNSTGDNTMSITGVSNVSNLSVDCKNCIIKNLDNNKVFSFTQIGWSSPSNIVWFRLRQGSNDLRITGNGQATLIYEMPYKKVGGWFE